MNKNIIIAVAVALIIAILVAIVIQIMLGNEAPPPVVEEVKIEILIADKDLALGDELEDGDTRWQEWPKNSVFPGAVVRKDNTSAKKALEGRVSREITKGEPLTKSAIFGESNGNFVASQLEAGMRAVALNVNPSSVVGGFVEPGDFVDVIMTYKQSMTTESEDPRVKQIIEQNLDKLATETLLQNVQVLAVDQKTSRPEEGKTRVGKTVTVAVSAKDVERIALARELGELSLALRGVGDDVVVDKEWPTVSDARLVTMDDEVYEELKKLENDTGIQEKTMRIYNGASIQAQPIN